MTDRERKRRALERKLSGILGEPVKVPKNPRTDIPEKCYAAVLNDEYPEGIVIVLDIEILEDREQARAGIKAQTGAQYVWYSDEPITDEIRNFIGRLRK